MPHYGHTERSRVKTAIRLAGGGRETEHDPLHGAMTVRSGSLVLHGARHTAWVGVLRVVLHLPESGSLKGKRQVVSSLLRRIRNEFQVAAAEVGELDRWQLAELAVVSVSGDRRHSDEVLGRVAAYIEARAGDAVVTDVATELHHL